MKNFKKTKAAALSLTLMLVIAGYINYEYNPEREKNLGQTVHVNSNAKEVDIYKDKPYNYNIKEDNIAVFKYDRDNMFSELTENYSKIIASTTTDKSVIGEYQKKLNDLLIKKNLIIMVENIIKSKGITDVVIIPSNNDNLNVVIKTKDNINPEDIAKIQQVITDEFNIKSDKITITQDKK